MALELPPPEPAWVGQLGQLLRERDLAAEPELEPEPQTDAPLLGRASDWLDAHSRPALTAFDAALSVAGVGYAATWDRASGAPGLDVAVTRDGRSVLRYWLRFAVVAGRLTATATLSCRDGRPVAASRGARLAGRIDLDALGADDLTGDLTSALGRCV
jgi:hypothetical protein